MTFSGKLSRFFPPNFQLACRNLRNLFLRDVCYVGVQRHYSLHAEAMTYGKLCKL